jgi:hypothetical protein
MARPENTARKNDDSDGYEGVNNDPRLVDTDFVKNQSLSSKGFDPDRKREQAANDAQYQEEAANEAQYQQYQLEQLALEEARDVARRTIARKQAILKNNRATGIAGKARAATGLVRWTGVGIAVTTWFWQFACAAISLVGIGAWATIEEIATGSLLGRASNWILGIFGSSLQNLFPAEMIAFGFWGLASLIALCAFIGFLLWFYLTGAKVFDTPITALITALVFACSLIPVSNLFPWIPLWVIYINLRSTAKMLGGIVGQSG